MIYRITGLDPAAFAHVAGADEAELAAQHAAHGCFVAKVERA